MASSSGRKSRHNPPAPRNVGIPLAALDCDVCLVVGTSAVVYPAAGLADEAQRRGAYTIEINPEATDATPRFDLAIAGRAEEVLDEIERALEC